MTTPDLHPLNFMPMEILEHIFSFLPVRDRHNVLCTCKLWATAVSSPSVWSFTEVHCDLDETVEEEYGDTSRGFLQKIQPYLAHFRYLKLVLDISLELNERLACTILDAVAWKSRKLQGLQVVCYGQKPPFCFGHDLLQGLRQVFQAMGQATMQHVDFRKVPFALENRFISLVASCSPNLRTLLLNNNYNLTMLRRDTVIEVVKNCPKLSTLGVFYFALSQKVIQELLSPDREPFKYLELFYDAVENDVPDECWVLLRERHPGFRVGLEIAPFITSEKMSEVLKPCLPINYLRFYTYTDVASQLMLVTKFYAGTLERLVLNSSPSVDLNVALIQVARTCVHLKEIHYFSVMSLDVVEAFQCHRPDLKMYATGYRTSFCDKPPTTVKQLAMECTTPL